MAKVNPIKRSNNRRSTLRLILWEVVSVILILATLEGAARLYLSRSTPLPDLTVPLTPPPPYKNSVYWSPEFVKALQDNRVYHSGPENLDARLTVSQPPDPVNSVWVFGSSTVFGQGVPDEDTLPSELQYLFNDALPGTYRVVNLGLAGAYNRVWKRKLEQIQNQFRAGDIVIFYGGVFDSGSVFEVAVNRQQLRGALICSSIWAKKSALVKLLCDWYHAQSPRELDDPAYLKSQFLAWQHDYETMIIEASTLARQHHAAFFHILEPYLFTRPLSQWEQYLADTVIHPKLKATWERALPYLNETANRLRSRGIETI